MVRQGAWDYAASVFPGQVVMVFPFAVNGYVQAVVFVAAQFIEQLDGDVAGCEGVGGIAVGCQHMFPVLDGQVRCALSDFLRFVPGFIGAGCRVGFWTGDPDVVFAGFGFVRPTGVFLCHGAGGDQAQCECGYGQDFLHLGFL